MKQKNTKIKKTFYILIAIFILLLTYFIFPAPNTTKRAFFPLVAILGFLFFILGGVLIYLTLKSKVKGKLKLYLLMTGFSALGFLVFVLLHNFVYGLFIYLFDEDFWIRTGLDDEPLFFILALFVCPIVFLIGVIGSVVCLGKK